MDAKEAFEEKKIVVATINEYTTKLKQLNEYLGEKLKYAILKEKVLSEYKWDYTDKSGYPGKLVLVARVPRGDEWRIMDLIPRDDFDTDEVVKGEVSISKYPPSRDPGHIFLIMEYDTALHWIDKLGLTVSGDFEEALKDRTNRVNVEIYEMNVLIKLKKRKG